MKWFTWEHWGFGIGSNSRYEPRWYERRAYVMGLRDAARIIDAHRFIRRSDDHEEEIRARRQMGRETIQAIHAFALRVLGLPADPKDSE